MGLLMQRFHDIMNQSKDPRMKEATFDVMYPTGFLPFDYLNGYITTVNIPNGKKMAYNSIGIMDGSSNVIIGRPGSGKTTFAVQAAANIIKPFPDAVMYIDDIERGSNKMRMHTLSGFSPEECVNRIIYRNEGITAENFYARVNMIHDEKISHRDDYEYDTGLLDFLGNPIYKLIPTVYILDSLAMLMPDKLTEEEELSGQMSTTATAKTNTAVLKRVIPKLKAANIILLVINHINQKIDINPFAKTKAQIAYLKQDETLPGGQVNNYLGSTMIRIDDSTKLKDTEGLGINGKIVDFSLVKSRTNNPGRSVSMIFNFDYGYDPILSLFTFMKSNGKIVSKGAYMNIEGSDIKFTQKGFLDKLTTDPEFANVFNTACRSELEKLLKLPDDDAKKSEDIRNEFMSSILGNSLNMREI